ncbi:hypothetical protein ES705_32152 [subsurface metagenome]
MFRWIVVSFIASISISILAAFLFMRRYSAEIQATIKPQLEDMKELVFDVQGALDHAKPQIARSQSIIAQHGTTPRQVKAGEKMIAQDIMEQYPEVQAVLGAVSPRTLEYFTDNPDILMEIIARWGPKIGVILGTSGVEGLLDRQEGSRSREWAWQE